MKSSDTSKLAKGHEMERRGRHWGLPLLFTVLVFVGVAGVSPAVALGLGILLRALVGNPLPELTARLAKQGIQAAVVLLGFGMNVAVVWGIGLRYALPGLCSIVAVLGLGYLLGRWLKVESVISTLISGGTAICGGSAIAALAPVLGARGGQVAVAMTVVFVLNGVALLVFPLVGHQLGLSEQAFGLWSALAIHDTSSVVGASAAYGQAALDLAVPVKLTRALWILPLCGLLVLTRRKEAMAGTRLPVPYFLCGFLLSAAVASLLPGMGRVWGGLSALGHSVLVGALFLVGAGLKLGELRMVGWRPMVQAVLLWVVAAVGLLFCVAF